MAINTDSTYLIQLSPSGTSRPDGTVCVLQGRDTDINANFLDLNTITIDTQNVGYWKVQQSFIGQDIQNAYTTAAAVALEPGENPPKELRFRIAAGGDCPAINTSAFTL